jgi:hypothetical protein
MSGRARFTGREQTAPSFVQDWLKRLETSLDGCNVNHTARIEAPPVASCQFPDPFVAFLPASRFFPSDSVALAQALKGPTDLPDWRHRALFFRDPEDNIIEIYAEY